MSTVSKYIFGVNITVKTDTSISDDTDIGLYNISATEVQLRWIQTAITTTLPYKSGILISVGKISNSSNFRNGGNTSQISSTEIKIGSIDIAQTQGVWKKLLDYGVSLLGCKVQIIEFNAASSPANETILFTGTVSEATTYDEEIYTISIENTYYKRKVNLSTVIDNSTKNGNYLNAPDSTNGKIVPIVYGDIDKASFLNSIKKVVKYSGVLDGITIDTFPVIRNDYPDSDAQKTFGILIPTGFTEYPVSPTDMSKWYLKIVKGAGEGEIRQITNGYHYSHTSNGMIVYYFIQDVFSVAINIDNTKSDAKNIEQTWIQLLNIEYEYSSDLWPCVGFSSSPPQLYAYNNQSDSNIDNITKFINIPTYAASVNVSPVNSFKLNLKLLSTENELMDFTLLPVTNVRAINHNDDVNQDVSEVWDTSSTDGYLSTNRYTPLSPSLPIINLFGTSTSDVYFSKLSATFTSSVFMNARNYNIYATINSNWIPGFSLFVNNPILGIGFNFPELTEGFTYDNMYLGIDLFCVNPNANTTEYAFRMRNWIGYSDNMEIGVETESKWYASIANSDISNHCRIRSVPNFWYLYNTPTDGNIDFYRKLTDTNGHYLVGYKNFPIKDIYKEVNANYRSAIFFRNASGEYRLRSLVIIFEKSITLEDVFYTDFSGRIFNHMDDVRKTSTSLISNPIDVIEHICRLQNWSEVDATEQAGKAYGTGALINTATTEGGFDNTLLDTLRGYTAQRQIVDFDEANTDILLKSLCQQYFLCNYQDNLGQECVNYVGSYSTTPDVVIAFADIIPDSISEITEQHISDIFCEPIIYYNYNYASQKYDGVFKITNSNADDYSPGYVTGYSDSGLAELVWNYSHVLWNKYKVINTPPDFLTQCKWIRTESDAHAYLVNWFRWMGVYKKLDVGYVFTPKRWITFSVGYDFAWTGTYPNKKPWYPSKHFLLNLPHETGGANTQTIIEKIDYDIDNGLCNITAIIFDVKDEIDPYIENSYDSYVTHGWQDWENTYYTKAEQPTNKYDIEKI